MQKSKFIPEDFDPTQAVTIIAGKYNYPVLMAAYMREQNIPLRLIAFEGETETSLIESFPESERKIIKVGQVGKMLNALKKFQAGYAVMAGQITPKRLFKGLHPDVKAITLLASLKERNAETIFGALANEIKKLDVRQLDARAFMDSDLADHGLMTKGKMKIESDHIDHGVRIAKTIASEDIGQGVVVSRGTVIAVEAFEGTDAMLERAGTFSAKSLLFVKTVKPNQDYRFDVPVFGIKTLDAMEASGIKAAALEADKVLLLEKPTVIEEANKRGIQLLGYSASQ